MHVRYKTHLSKAFIMYTFLSQAGHSCPEMLVFEISASAKTSSNGLLGRIPNPLEIITTGDGCASYWTLYGIGHQTQIYHMAVLPNNKNPRHSRPPFCDPLHRGIFYTLPFLTLRLSLLLFLLKHFLLGLFTYTRLSHLQCNLISSYLFKLTFPPLFCIA